MAETLINVRVARKVPLAQDICAFDLVAADGGALPPFEAGAHIDVHLDAAAGGWVRPYSLCSPPLERHRWQIAALREPASRGGSVAMHERVSVGSLLAVSVPRHHFALAARAGHSLLLAGGIGITPLLAMAEQLWAQGADFELHHCTRTLARTPFRERVAAAPWAGRVHGHLDDGPPAQRLDLDALLATPAPETHLYVCGPQGFMDAVLGRARALGWPESRLHWEAFHAEVAPQASDRPFELQLARSGRTITVAAGQTAVHALEAAGVFVPTSCEQGVCGTCLTRVLEGTPEHRDQYLTADEQAAGDQFTPCCSRALGARLVIDL